MSDDDNISKVVPIAEKRKPPRAGMGRPKGVPNKTTSTLKAAIEQAFDDLGGVAWLVALGRNDPKAFAALLAKLIPPATEETGDLNIHITGGF